MDLYTIIVQLLNFAVLLILLNKFLYKPLLNAVEKRKENIKKQVEDTQNRLNESEALKEEYLSKLKDIEKENIILKQQVIDDMEIFKKQELEKINKELIDKQTKMREYVSLEEKNMIDNFYRKLADSFIDYSNLVFKNLANTNLQTQIVNKFIEKISLLSIDRVNAINQNIVNSKLYIYSNDEIKHDNKEIIKDSLIKKGFIFNNIEYIIKTDLILGIELKVGNNLISWTIKDINENFESVINKILDKDSV